MANLSHSDRTKLLSLLQELPTFQSFRGRQQLLSNSGLDFMIPQIDLEGPPYIVAGDLITRLEKYGRVTYDHEALGVFLSSVKETMGNADPQHTLIDDILLRCQLMTPIRATDQAINWKTETNFAEHFEKIIGENTLRHISFLERALEVSRGVCLVDTGKWVGTGFTLTDNLVITNHHVLPGREILSQTKFLFNYQLSFDGKERKVKEHKAKVDGTFISNAALDYAVLEVSDFPGLEWGITPIASQGVSKGARVNIVQHPAGMPKQISFQNNIVQYSDDTLIQYVASTLGGSSGSPVFDDTWHVVGLHHAGGRLVEPSTGQEFFRNEAISIFPIMADIPASVRCLISC